MSRSKRKKRILKLVLFAFILLGLGAATVSGYFYWKVNELMHKTSDPPVNNLPSNSEAKDPLEEKNQIVTKPFGMVLLGEDYRPETGSRNTDAIIVTIWNPESNEVNLLSIPRDTRVNIPGYGYGKINSVYVIGEAEKRKQERQGQQPTTNGAKMVMETISDFLDIPVKYYVKVDFNGFEQVIDELGGLMIEVERDMNYHSVADHTNIELKKGLQLLDGKQVLDYARFRKSSDGKDSSDFERNERHQKIIRTFVGKLGSFKGVSNIVDIMEIAGDHIKTNLTPDEMKDLLWKYKGINKSDIYSIQMTSFWENPYVYIDKNELLRVQNELKKAQNKTTEENANDSKDNN